MRPSRKLLSAASVIFTAGFAATAQASTVTYTDTALQADSVVDSFGVVTHFPYTNTAYYQQSAKVIGLLQQLGVRHVRDGYYPWSEGNPILKIHQQLAAAGIGCNFVVPYSDTETAENMAAFAARSGDAEAFEYPNEYNLSGVSDWAERLHAMGNVVAQAGRTAKLPVFGPALTTTQAIAQVGSLQGFLSHDNTHIYFGGRNPGVNGWGPADSFGNGSHSIAWWLDAARTTASGVPNVVTETGYINVPHPTQQYTIDTWTAASYLPRTVLEMLLHGVKRAYVYELLDTPQDSAGYGIVDESLVPKPAFTALQHLLGALSDRGPAFVPGSLQYGLTNAGSNVHRLLVQKRDGSFYLALWIEASSYDMVKLRPTSVPRQWVTLAVPAGYAVQNYAQLSWDGSMPVSALKAGQWFALTSNITLVRIAKLS